MIIKTVPEEIVSQANILLTNKAYTSKFRAEVVRMLLGRCVICGGVPNFYIIDKQDDIEVISRYCEKDYTERYQKRNKKKRVKLG